MGIDEAILIMENERPHCGDKLTFTEEERYEAYTWAIGALKELSSAQLEERTKERTKKRTETHACDLIKRQDAIDAAVEAADEWDGGYSRSREEIITMKLRMLPSAQPGTARRIVGKSRDGITLWYQCDMCNEPVDAQDNFCSGCGRRLTDG